MCGIVGYVGKKRVVPVIIDGLEAWNIADMTQRGLPCAAMEMAERCRCAAPKASCATWKRRSA